MEPKQRDSIWLGKIKENLLVHKVLSSPIYDPAYYLSINQFVRGQLDRELILRIHRPGEVLKELSVIIKIIIFICHLHKIPSPIFI